MYHKPDQANTLALLQIGRGARSPGNARGNRTAVFGSMLFGKKGGGVPRNLGVGPGFRAYHPSVPIPQKRGFTAIQKSEENQMDARTLAVWNGDRLMVRGRLSGYSIERDGVYATMWRLRAPDGRLSDMVNRVRAKEAAFGMLDRDLRAGVGRAGGA